MIATNNNSENSEQSPFQGDILLDSYFPCTSRAEVLSQMEEAVENGQPLMVLTGEEGSGKTMLCRVLEQDTQCQTVFFPDAVDSFEEVVQNIAISFGLIREIEIGEVDQSLQHIIDFLLDQSVDLLVIFDEAENIFLATLEQIFEMLDWINGAGAGMHILLSGRTTLLENCDQISLGNLRNTDTRYFELLPLSEAETADYLYNCAVGLPGMDPAKVFTDEVISNIYTLAQGNFRITSISGEEAIKAHSDDSSFMVLLDGVKGDVDSTSKKLDVLKLKYPQLPGKITRYLPWIGGAVCCLLLLVILFRSGSDKSEVGKEVILPQKADQMEKVTTLEQTDNNLSEKKELAVLAPVEELQPPEEEETAAVPGQEEKLPGEETAIVPQSAEKPSEPVIDQEQDGAVHVASETGKAAGTVTTATVENRDSALVAEKEAQEVTAKVLESPPQEVATKEIKDIARLRPGKHVKKKTELSSAQESRSAKPQPPVQQAVPERAVSPAHSAADRLYNARLSAGSGWQSKEKKKMFTVQVMALTSKTADKNLKDLLAQVNYRQEAGNLYIFEKKTAPEGIFVFYGEYPSVDRARLAQNSLPQFLRDHKPYVLSINKAVTKVGR